MKPVNGEPPLLLFAHDTRTEPSWATTDVMDGAPGTVAGGTYPGHDGEDCGFTTHGSAGVVVLTDDSPTLVPTAFSAVTTKL